MGGNDVRALRAADSICFDHGWAGDEGNGQIRAIKRGPESDPFGGETTVTIPVEYSRVNNYGPGDGPWAGFAMLMSAQYDDIARTLVRHIKSSSRVGFVWTRDNSSPVTKEAGIVVDFLDVKVHSSDGRQCDTFRVSTYIGYDNTARMIRRAR